MLGKKNSTGKIRGGKIQVNLFHSFRKYVNFKIVLVVHSST